MDRANIKSLSEISALLSPKQKARLHEVADILLSIIRTLERMRYLQPEWINPGPHNIDALLPLYHSLHLDPSIIYLYSILPYLEQPNIDFFQGSSFADFRTEEDVREGRNPMHDGDPAAHMRPWMTPLSMLGNHDSVIIYDAKRHVIGIFDQIYGGSSDPNLYEGRVCCRELEDGSKYVFKVVEGGREVECEMWELEEQTRRDEEEAEDGYEDGYEEEEDEGVDVDERGEEDGNGNGDEDDEDDEDEGVDVAEENYWDEMDSRPAPNVLRDIIRWYRELYRTPGGGENSAGWEWDSELVTPLYRKHGWPSDNFDGNAFQVDQVRAVARSRAKDEAQQPLADLQTAKHWLERQLEQEASATPKRLARLAAAKSVHEEWTIRWEIWQVERHTEDLRKKLEKAQEMAERLCPNGQGPNDEDLLLLELKQVQIELLRETGSARPSRAQILLRAYEACLADVERLCPGRPPLPTGPEIDFEARAEQCTSSIGEYEEEVAKLRDWMDRLPDGAVQAKLLAQAMVEARLDSIGHLTQQRRGCIDRIKKLRGRSA
ncbi:hypothetical protein C8A03DRAFT_19145 [Achaetomium macrosporum]|uniref:Uncharacterized protein n=1 Tax=Achaetomium macrosporum TaxID=79813 RepID=A0AAN7C254_9PEZI|nr:hypothetical protein C8A03DRAFT_19145 [Achaetomium macrosporum]